MTNPTPTDSERSENLPAQGNHSGKLPGMMMNELGGMGAESGFDQDDSNPPLRFSGFVSLIFGGLSWVALVAAAAVVIPIISILFGLFALRPSKEGKPAGILPAKLGIVLAVGFAVCGLMLPMLKTKTLGEQAKEFSLRYMELVDKGYDEVAIELKKQKRNRFGKEMPLKDHYLGSDQHLKVLTEFRGNGVNQMIRAHGNDKPWVLDRPVRVYHKYHIDRAEVIWKAGDGKKIQFFMQYLIDNNDVGQWHIDICQPHREMIVAESIL